MQQVQQKQTAHWCGHKYSYRYRSWCEQALKDVRVHWANMTT